MEPLASTHGGSEAREGIRILAVGNMYPPQHAGGYELAWQQAMRHARALGHQVRVLTSDYRAGPGSPEEDPDVHRALRWYWDLERYRFPRLNPLQRLALERHNARVLRQHIAAFRPDVVAWWSMGCMSLSLIEQAKLAGIPGVLVVHDDWLVYGPQHDQWIRLWRGRGRSLAAVVERLCRVPTSVDLKHAGPAVFNSRYTLERATETGLEPLSPKVIHPGIDERFLAATPAQPWRWRLLYVGRIDRQKGIDTAVAALAHLPADATLAVWGSGDEGYVAELREMAASLGAQDRLQLHGFADPDVIRSAYAQADVVVFPVRWNEPFGLVPLEAMGLGRPVVTTSRGGTAEFVRDGENALVFAADDAAAMADCIKRLAGDEDLRTRLLDGGRRTAERFTAGRFAELTVEQIVGAARSQLGLSAH